MKFILTDKLLFVFAGLYFLLGDHAHDLWFSHLSIPLVCHDGHTRVDDAVLLSKTIKHYISMESTRDYLSFYHNYHSCNVN